MLKIQFTQSNTAKDLFRQFFIGLTFKHKTAIHDHMAHMICHTRKPLSCQITKFMGVDIHLEVSVAMIESMLWSCQNRLAIIAVEQMSFLEVLSSVQYGMPTLTVRPSSGSSAFATIPIALKRSCYIQKA